MIRIAGPSSCLAKSIFLKVSRSPVQTVLYARYSKLIGKTSVSPKRRMCSNAQFSDESDRYSEASCFVDILVHQVSLRVWIRSCRAIDLPPTSRNHSDT